MAEYLKPGYYALILDSGDRLQDEIARGEKFRQIERDEALIANSTDLDLEDPFAATASGARSGCKDHDKLEPRESPAELYQVRLGVEDGMDYYAKIPSGTERYGVYEKKAIGKITALTSSRLAMNEDYEFWLQHGLFPSFEADNVTPYSMTPNIYFEGRKYNVRKVTETEKSALQEGRLPYRVIVLGGVFP